MAANLSLALGICNDLCSLVSVETVASLVINRQQCMLLSKKLLETQETLQAVQHKLSDDDEMTWSDSPYTGAILLELIYVLQKAKKIVLRDCFCSGQWMEAALRQGGDWKETFGESLYDLHWLCSILLKQVGQDSQVLERADCDRMLRGTDINTLLTAAKKDHEDLKGLLRDLRGNHTCSAQCHNGEGTSMQCLATQLLTELEFQAELQAWPVTKKKNYHEWLYKDNLDNLSKWPLVLSVNKQDLKRGSLLGEGSFGIVHEAEWLGEPYAMKISKYGYEELLKQEIAVLSGLYHPHIMHLVCCAEEGGECLYVMECMNKSLSRMLEKSKLSLIRSVDIMLQIAEGMNHLHSMGLVHRDLKPDNILIKCDEAGSGNSMSALGAEPLLIAKVSDFGCTKVKMESTAYAHQTIPIGSLMFMAPEVYELAPDNDPPERFHPKKTDVYSFGLICFAVLIGEPTPFPPKELMNPSVKAFQDGVRKGKRPQLPADSPNHLSSLIQQCWDGNPVKRPNFHNICTELRYIKGLLLTAFRNTGHGDASYVKDAKQTCIKGLPQLASCSTDATDAKSNETTAKSLLHLAKETSLRRLQIPRLVSVLDLVRCLGLDKPPLVVMTLNQLYNIVTTSHWQHWQHDVLEANAIPELTRLLQSNNITIAKTANPMQKAVIDASGHKILLQCLQEETLKPLAAKGLAELLKTQPNQLPLIKCPDPEGKKAAAKVIDSVFSELEDCTEIITNCGLLINLVGEQYKEDLEALEVVTRESSGKLSAYKEKVLDFLVPLLQSNSDISIQDLVLLILANLSCDIITDSTDTEKHSIRWAMGNSDIPGILYERANTFSSKGLLNMIVIIRNISLAGPDACKKLLEDDGAAHFLITKLLRVHLQQEMEITDVITYSVIALEKFAEDDHGKTVIVTNKGVDVLVDILQRIAVNPARAKVYATKILVMLADDESLQKAVCKALFEAKPLTGLMDILKSAYKDVCKGRAATLIKYLVMHGPPHALTSIVQAGCIEVLYENLPVAKDALNYICFKSREADNRCRKLQRSQSSGSKLSEWFKHTAGESACMFRRAIARVASGLSP